MRKDFREMMDEDCRAQLARCIPSTRFNILLKCWDLPRGSKQVRSGHCGEHTEVMRYCIESPKFKTILGQCRTSVEKLWQQQDRVTVLCLCSHGYHRSVAVSSALQCIYQMEGYTSKGPCHLDHQRDLCAVCSRCKPDKDKYKMCESFVVDSM